MELNVILENPTSVDMQFLECVIQLVSKSRDPKLFNTVFKLLENNFMSQEITKDFIIILFKKVYNNIKRDKSIINQFEISPKLFKIYLETPEKSLLMFVTTSIFSIMPKSVQIESIVPILNSLFIADNQNHCAFQELIKQFADQIGREFTIKFFIESLNSNEQFKYCVTIGILIILEAFEFFQSNFTTITRNLMAIANDHWNESTGTLLNVYRSFKDLSSDENDVQKFVDAHYSTLLENHQYLLLILGKKYPKTLEKHFLWFWKNRVSSAYYYKFMDSLMVSLDEDFRLKYLDICVEDMKLSEFKNYPKSLNKFIIRPKYYNTYLWLTLENQVVFYLLKLKADDPLLLSRKNTQSLNLKVNYSDNKLFPIQHTNLELFETLWSFTPNWNVFKHYPKNMDYGLLDLKSFVDSFLDFHNINSPPNKIYGNSVILGMVEHLFVRDQINFGLPYIEISIKIFENFMNLNIQTQYTPCYVCVIRVLEMAKESQMNIDNLIEYSLNLLASKLELVYDPESISVQFHRLLMSTNHQTFFGEYVHNLLKHYEPDKIYKFLIKLIDKPNRFTLDWSHDIFKVHGSKVDSDLYWDLVNLLCPFEFKSTQANPIESDFILKTVLYFSVELNLNKIQDSIIISNLAMVSKRFFNAIGDLLSNNESLEIRYKGKLMSPYSIIQPGKFPGHLDQSDFYCIPLDRIENLVYDDLKSLTLNGPINILGTRPCKSLLKLNLASSYHILDIFINILNHSPALHEIKFDLTTASNFVTQELLKCLTKETHRLQKLIIIISFYKDVERSIDERGDVDLFKILVKEMKNAEKLFPNFKFTLITTNE
ncbi:hypothetical protein DLAC_00076 [Tieghemostelium lacteum]|uniref:Uncharacterized protein n=1 Tax=Tieghemostelium lacteum TaxID=361077 RepID=A0A152A986_TIELA|nr:hypothetical protein DLAC_00076 [Tieghemostelium lacteum]|eukprot:KYR02627.1 hypothetical protein DLAC_00076 [Tieghemostelium lacteum]